MLPILQVEQMGVETRSVCPEAHVSDILLQKKKDEKTAVLFSIDGKALHHIFLWQINQYAPKCFLVTV